MITQDYPPTQKRVATQNLVEDETIDPRIPQIIELRSQGLTWSKIAENMNLSRKQIYNIRHSDPCTTYLVEYLFPKTLKIINTILEDPTASDYKLTRAIDETHKLIRALIPKRIEQKTLQITAKLDLDSRRDYAREVLEEVRSLDQGAYELMLRAMLSIDTNRSHEDS